MCRWRSGWILKSGVRLNPILRDQSHAATAPRDRGIEPTGVKVEILPRGHLDSTDPAAWEVHIDQDILPDWFTGPDDPACAEAIARHCADVGEVAAWTFDGNLDLCDCAGLTSLPAGLAVDGYLYLNGCVGLTSLPAGLSVGGALYLYNCAGLTALPDGLSVGANLYLYNCAGLTALPDGLSVSGGLDLRDCAGLKDCAIPPGIVRGKVLR